MVLNILAVSHDYQWLRRKFPLMLHDVCLYALIVLQAAKLITTDQMHAKCIGCPFRISVASKKTIGFLIQSNLVP
jgi:hypothetical protein